MPRSVGYARKLTKRPVRELVEAVADARQKLSHGQRFRKDNREKTWEASERQYIGDHWFGTNTDDPTADFVVVNMSFSTVNTIVPYVTASDPQFLVSPYSGNATVKNAALQKALLNRQWRSRKISGNKHLADVTVDAIIYGDGWGKAGYSIIERRVNEDDYADIAELWVARINPWDVWIDPTSDGLHNARWVCQRILIPRRELEESNEYKNVHIENVNYGARSEEIDRSPLDSARFVEEILDGSEYAILYEFTDLVNKTVITFSDGDLPLRWVEDIGESMLVQMGNYRLPNSPYHMGELEQLWKLQVELNKTRSQMITHRRRNVQKFFARENALEQPAIDALKSSIVNDVVFVKGDAPLDSLVAAAEVPTISADAYNISDVIQRDIYEISGVNEYLRGATPEIRRTATEATIIEGASNIKTQNKLRMVEGAARELGTLLLGIARDVYPQTDYDEVQLFLTGREADAVARATAGAEIAALMDSGAPQEEIGAARASFDTGVAQDVTMTPDPDMWEGEYEVEVEQSSTELRNPQLREQKYREMATEMVAMYPALVQAGIPVNLKRFLELWFEQAQVDDVDALFEAPPMPMAPPMGGAEAPGAPQIPGQPPAIAPNPLDMGVLSAENTGAMPPA